MTFKYIFSAELSIQFLSLKKTIDNKIIINPLNQMFLAMASTG